MSLNQIPFAQHSSGQYFLYTTEGDDDSYAPNMEEMKDEIEQNQVQEDNKEDEEQYLFRVDKAYGIISRFSGFKDPKKMVFKARDFESGSICVLKLYTELE